MGQMKRVIKPVLLVAVLLLTAASAGSDGAATSSSSSTNRVGVGGSDIAAVLMAAHQGEIDIGHLATAKATALKDLSDRTRRNLSLYSGATFDRTYMQTQVEMHAWLLNQIDSTLMPSARGEMRLMITGQREAVAADLDQARSILSSL